ncbi:MAG: FkbM family methyltransferase, partial [Puniceicoccales bacterium]|nr:FkbM family methyltransferase [Puniceicoccales bacterium]
MDTKKFFVSFLVAALCAIPISSYCNHRRLRIGVAAQKSKLGSAKSKPGSIQNGKKLLSKEEVATLAREVLGEDFQGGFLIHKVMLDGKPFLFCDLASSNVVDIVSREIGVSTYDFSNIDFKEGDVVIDIGGNVGMISIFLAKKFPFLKIYAFEPVRENFENFKRNIKLNKIPDGTIVVENLAVTKNGRDISMLVNTLVSGSSAMAEYAP